MRPPEVPSRKALEGCRGRDMEREGQEVKREAGVAHPAALCGWMHTPPLPNSVEIGPFPCIHHRTDHSPSAVLSTCVHA